MNNAQEHITELMWTGIKAVLPETTMPDWLSYAEGCIKVKEKLIEVQPDAKLIVIAIGKASAAMAEQAEQILGDRITAGLCIAKHGHGLALQHFELIESGHPIPDEHSVDAANKVLDLLQGLRSIDVLLLLISGGASSLMVDLPGEISLSDLQHCFDGLIKSGANIQQVNTVRKHLSRLKGGQLALQAQPATLVSLMVSDVVGDDIACIGSGLTAPDTTTYADAKQVLLDFNCWERQSQSIQRYIDKGIAGLIPDTIKPDEPLFNNVLNAVIGSNAVAVEAVMEHAKMLGYECELIAKDLTGDTIETAKFFVNYIAGWRGKLPACFIMGGETSLAVNANGKGGRNQHFVLAALKEWLVRKDGRRLILLSAGTDGTDGPTNANGAFFDSDFLDNISAEVVEEHLLAFSSYDFFEQFGGHILTGPTQTNVMDLMIALLY